MHEMHSQLHLHCICDSALCFAGSLEVEAEEQNRLIGDESNQNANQGWTSQTPDLPHIVATDLSAS